MSANDKVRDIEEHAAALAEAMKVKVARQKGLAEPFEAASLPPPKLPEVFIPIDVDTVLGVDAFLRNAVFQIGLGDTEGVRRNVQAAIAKIQPAFEASGKALTRRRPSHRFLTLGTRSIKDEIYGDIKLSPDKAVDLPRGTSITFPAHQDWCFDISAIPRGRRVMLFVKGDDGENYVGEGYTDAALYDWFWSKPVDTGDDRVRGTVKAWQHLPQAPDVIPEAPKGSPCSFPESWGTELGA